MKFVVLHETYHTSNGVKYNTMYVEGVFANLQSAIDYCRSNGIPDCEVREWSEMESMEYDASWKVFQYYMNGTHVASFTIHSAREF